MKILYRFLQWTWGLPQTLVGPMYLLASQYNPGGELWQYVIYATGIATYRKGNVVSVRLGHAGTVSSCRKIMG